MNTEAFLATDNQLFERLHSGSPGPLVVHLTDGRTVRGEIVSVRRSGAIGVPGARPSGELWLQTPDGPVHIDYAAISSFA